MEGTTAQSNGQMVDLMYTVAKIHAVTIHMGLCMFLLIEIS
jgi:choline-glycine betaine transporter